MLSLCEGIRIIMRVLLKKDKLCNCVNCFHRQTAISNPYSQKYDSYSLSNKSIFCLLPQTKTIDTTRNLCVLFLPKKSPLFRDRQKSKAKAKAAAEATFCSWVGKNIGWSLGRTCPSSHDISSAQATV